MQVPAFTAADPFAGTPAEHYSSGTAGIVAPAAHAVGGYSATKVAAAYAMTRRLLIAANLDPTTLSGHRPAAFAALLTSQQRSAFLRGMSRRGRAKDGVQRSTRTWVTSFAPGRSAIVGSVVKVHGTMTSAAERYAGRDALRVRADYLFVYPVQRPGQPTSRTRVMARVVADVYYAQWDDAGGLLEPWIGRTDNSWAGSRCDIADGFVHPEFPSGHPDKVRPSGAPIDPYNQGVPAGPRLTCQAVTRT